MDMTNLFPSEGTPWYAGIAPEIAGQNAMTQQIAQGQQLRGTDLGYLDQLHNYQQSVLDDPNKAAARQLNLSQTGIQQKITDESGLESARTEVQAKNSKNITQMSTDTMQRHLHEQ